MIWSLIWRLAQDLNPIVVSGAQKSKIKILKISYFHRNAGTSQNIVPEEMILKDYYDISQSYVFAPVNFMEGIQTTLVDRFELNSGYLKTDTLKDHEDIVNLLRQIPRQLEQIQILLKKGTEYILGQ